MLEGFDAQAWQDDSDGCNHGRSVLVEELILRKDELAGLGQKDIVKLLGKPNRHELYSRHKKAFIYHVKNGPECSPKNGKVSKLIIRFDALERVKEVVWYK